jgi:hypothetical protein
MTAACHDAHAPALDGVLYLTAACCVVGRFRADQHRRAVHGRARRPKPYARVHIIAALSRSRAVALSCRRARAGRGLFASCALDAMQGCWHADVWSLEPYTCTTAWCRDVCVASVVVNLILSARVVLSPVVSVVTSVRRNERSHRDEVLG